MGHCWIILLKLAPQLPLNKKKEKSVDVNAKSSRGPMFKMVFMSYLNRKVNIIT